MKKNVLKWAALAAVPAAGCGTFPTGAAGHGGFGG
jgi:hypothetical protein